MRERKWLLLMSLFFTVGFLFPTPPTGAGNLISGPMPGDFTKWSTTTVTAVKVDAKTVGRPSKGNHKLESSLNQLLEVDRCKGLAEAQAFAMSHNMVLQHDRVQVTIVTSEEAVDDVRDAMEAVGGAYQTHYRNLLQALVPIGELEVLAERPDVQVIREPRRPIPQPALPPMPMVGSQTTQGVAASNASVWHADGYDGTGVRVAVIDSGFIGYSGLLGTDLPGSVTTYDWTGTGMQADTEHGTACAEVVYDMAHGAAMDLHKVGTDVELGNAVDQAITDGADIISMSGGFLLDGPGDGTGNLADIVNDARSNGIFYATAAGNNAEHCWSGTFTDTAGDDAHEWVPGVQNINYFGPGDGSAWVIPAGFPIVAGLHWDDWTVVDQDYDMELFYWDGSAWQYVTGSYNDQEGGYPTPDELIGIYAPVDAPYGIVVWRFSSTRDVCLRLIASHAGPDLNERVLKRSLSFPADSPDAITVGAVDVSSPYPLESYSSRGPTFGPGGACSGGSTKPDIAAYANVDTVSYGPGLFNGTSAATPHVAGAAALVKNVYPGYTVTQLQNHLETNAIDLGNPGKDKLFGSGRLYLGLPSGEIYDEVTLLSPNGGEVIPSGSPYTIEWGAPPEAETFKLKFSPDNGATWELIEEELAGTSYDSEVPTFFTKNQTNCLIKVVGYDASGAKVGADKSDGTFTIAVLTVTSPNGGEVVPSGDTYDIEWETNGTESEVESVELFYSRDGGTTWKLIEEALIGNPGTYEWTVPAQKKNLKNCLVKVKALDVSGNKVAVDKSDAPFTIAVLEVTSPNGGEILTSGATHTITWTTNETKAEVTKVKLLYTKNGGDTWIKIDTLTGGDPGTYEWLVPSVNKVKTECRVKVELKDAQGNIVGKATSDSYFTIEPLI